HHEPRHRNPHPARHLPTPRLPEVPPATASVFRARLAGGATPPALPRPPPAETEGVRPAAAAPPAGDRTSQRRRPPGSHPRSDGRPSARSARLTAAPAHTPPPP